MLEKGIRLDGRSDVVSFLKNTAEHSFDVVVCDPPKLAPSAKDLPRAVRKYKQINGLAMQVLKKGGAQTWLHTLQMLSQGLRRHSFSGLMLSCTCSAAMTQSGGFIPMLHQVASAQSRTITVLRTAGPAADHVIHPCCPESNYLTAVLVYVS